jgi:hypothetical protein
MYQMRGDSRSEILPMSIKITYERKDVPNVRSGVTRAWIARCGDLVTNPCATKQDATDEIKIIIQESRK